MIEHWPFWAGGLALAAVALGHWLLTGRLMAVSGRFSRLVDLVRFGQEEEAPVAASEEDIMAMLLQATQEEFGEAAAAGIVPEAGEAAAETDTPAKAPLLPKSSSVQPWWFHLAFFAALAAGGGLSAALAGAWEPRFGLRGEVFASLFGSSALGLWPLALGGALVGFGTRMSGGCTSGHGLCGVSRVQRGSLLATTSFFGAGIGVSLLLRAVVS